MLAFPLILAVAAATAQSEAVPLYDNLGDYHHEITTRSPMAQKYFDQGLRLIYAFNHNEAVASFEEALKHDDRCAMCYWGIAFALGPNINLPMDSASGVAAYMAVSKAKQLANGTTPFERAMIDALSRRYGADPLADRAKLDTAFANAMRDVARRFPADDEAQTLFADAVMNLSPWIYWTADRKPRPQIPEILEALERVTNRNAKHAGACHLYIHAVEATFPERAEACADRLAGLMPGAGHIVHMPGHIYIRVGRYADAIAANQHAIHEDEKFIEDRRPDPMGAYPLGYYPHNYHFLNFAAMMAANEPIAMQSARDLAAKSTPDLLRLSGAVQHYLVTPLFAALRFERWQEVLDAPMPPADLPYPVGLWRYARGVALARMGQPDRAETELAELRKLADLPELEKLLILSYNTASASLGIAVPALAGEIAAARGQWDQAIDMLRKAVWREDQLVYIEPPEWAIPPRQQLGRVQLLAGRFADAQKTFEEDLARFNENVWSLRGLAESLTRQGKTAEAAAVEKRVRKAIEGTKGVKHPH